MSAVSFLIVKDSDSFTGVREACWKHQHSGEQLSIFITGYFPVRAKHSGEQLSIFITGYFPNASPLLRPYDS
ncbi:MAG: hypothetical protein ACKPBB_07760 [Sphaerospermopsis kisseleviana]